jgi:isopenicillin-N N-acyltransferase-like protein
MKLLDVRGEPREVGQAIGEATRSELRESLEEVRAAIRSLPVLNVDKTVANLVAMLKYWTPDFYEEIRGIAEGAGLADLEVHVLASGVELVAQSQGHTGAAAECTTFGVGGSRTDGDLVVLGSNKDTKYRFRGRAIVVRRRMPKRAARLDFISLVGFQRFGNLNERGMAKLGTGVRTGFPGHGLPSSASVELVLSAKDLAGARAVYARAPWASGWTSIVTDGRKMMIVEASPRRVVTEEVASDFVVTTNHFGHPKMNRLGPGPEEFPSSYIRRERMASLLSAVGRLTVDDAMAALRDHTNGPGNDSICRHDDAHDEGTIFSIVQRPALGEMWVALGHPCTTAFARFTL